MVPEGEALRVVHVHLGIKGGAERFFVSLVNALAERGVQQKALLFPDRVWKKDIEAVCGASVPFFRITYSSKALSFLKPCFCISCAAWGCGSRRPSF